MLIPPRLHAIPRYGHFLGDRDVGYAENIVELVRMFHNYHSDGAVKDLGASVASRVAVNRLHR